MSKKEKVKFDAMVNLRIDTPTKRLVEALAHENNIKTAVAWREIVAVGLNEILTPKKTK